MLCWLREDEMSVQELLQRVECVITHVEIMQQEIRPLLAMDIIEQLHRQFALLSGRGKDGAPIITFPEYSGFSEVPEEDFLNVVTYLTSIPLDAASIGFVIIIDRRKDKWSSVKASLSRIAGAFPGNLQLVLVLRPSRFFQRAIADIGIKLHKDDFKMKVPIVMLNSLSDLHGYVEKGQLTRELGGNLEYCHSQWIHHRTAIENFAMTVKSTAQMLQKFGTDLAETELPNDVQCTKDLLTAHTDKHNNLKDELRLALKQGTTLLGCIKEQAAKSENHKLNPDEMENQTTVELLAQLDETENAFEQFWCKHHLKLEQCLQLRHFEQDFREQVKVSLDSLMDSLSSLSDIGDCVTRVELLLKDLKTLEEKAKLEKAQLHALHGDQLIQSNHYAVDSIRPKCVELRRVCDDFSNEAKKKTDVLSKSLQIHTGIDKQVNQWCESGIYLLASQAVDKCQSTEGAESALTDIDSFLESAQKNQLTELKNLHNQYEVVLSEEIKALKRLEDVQEMFEKRHVSLKRLSAKQTRPVQPVAPRPESSPKRPSLKRASDNTNSGKPPVEADPNKKRIIRKAKGGIKHIMTELIETERLYVEELQSIMEQGYFAELDNSELSHLIPPSLENKRDVLFGNLPEIYEFETFLKELENCAEKPELVGTCFLKRKEELQVYEKYCQNKPRSEVLWRQCGDSLFFQECQKKLDHKLSLDAYLLKPVQRITKYQLMLKEMLKCSKGEGTTELEEAFATVLDIIKSVNDSMHQIAITGFEKDLARFKPMQRHLFLYNKMLLFCKKREETTDGHEKTPSYSFKHSLKNVRKMALRQSDSSSPESGFRRTNPSPNMRQKRDASASQSGLSAANARKRFTLQGLSNRRSLPAPLSASIKSKRHEIKSDPTPFGYEWAQRRLPSMDTDDFETIHSSAEESSNSSEEEGNNKNSDSGRFRVQLTYESREGKDLSLETGDLVQFVEEAENGHLVKNLLTEETGLVPASILQTASEGIFSDLCTAALSDSDENEASTWGDVSQD
uniref:MCF.2 cell line derived transforming sequence-like 2 n=1 Tax=Labrus bergylta TaxID=56723 RepID=A0A3Q3E4T7_9LABR